MSVSLSEERDRIQRQVEELEQSLSGKNTDLQLLSSDTDDESGSDEKEDESAGDLLAQREKIEKEIQNLENVLGPHNPDDDSSSSSDESELGLSHSVESCLQMNLVYQQVLQETLSQLETLLTHNVKQQKELVSQLSGRVKEPPREQTTSSSYQLPNTMYLGRFLKPYFKDKLTGLGPPANQETKEKASRMAGCLDERKVKVKRWESWQKTLIIHAVARDSLRKLIQPKLSRMEYLTQKLSTAPETEKQQLREQVDSLEKEIDCLRKKKEEELIGERFEEHDWQKISNIDFEGTRDAEDIRCFWQNFLHPSIDKSRWSQEEVQQLREISGRHGEKDWKTIAEELGTGRTAFMCLQTFQRFVSESLKRRTWTPAEDTLLRELVEKMRIGNFIPYTQMSYFMDGRDPAQLIYRWNQVLDPSLKKGPWTKEEDKLLLQAVSRHGEKNWWKIRLEVPGRTDSACRDRYQDCLKEGTKRGAFDKQERELLQQLVEKYGVGRWAKIAAEIPNRIDAQCLREWKKLSRQQTNPAQKGGKSKNPPKKQISRKPVKIKVEESSEDSTEEEDMVVKYMDSDNEEIKENEENVEVEIIQEKCDQEKDYTFPPLKEWIPVDKEEQPPFLNFRFVVLPSCDSHSGVQVRSTIVDKFGLSAFVGPRPRELQWEERHMSTGMKMLSPDQLRAYLSHLLAKSTKQRSPPKGKHQTGKNNRLGHMMGSELCYHLQAAVTPWIGNLLIPAKTRLTAADTLREQGEKTKLSSTAVFVLLLQTMNVDTIGCKEMIEQRKKKLASQTASVVHSSVRRRGPQTVAGILQQRSELDELEVQHKLIGKQLETLQLQKHQKQLLHNQKVQSQQIIMLQQPRPVPPQNRHSFLQMPPVPFSQPFYIPHHILQHQQPRAATLQSIPSYFLNTSFLPLHRPPLHAPPVSIVSKLQNTPPNSSSPVLHQAVPLSQALILAQPSIPNQTTGSTLAKQTTSPTCSSHTSLSSVPPNSSLNSPSMREQKGANSQQEVCSSQNKLECLVPSNDVGGTDAGVTEEARATDLQEVTKTKDKLKTKAAASSPRQTKSQNRSSPPQTFSHVPPQPLDAPSSQLASLAPPPVGEPTAPPLEVNIPPISVLPLSSFHGEVSARQNLRFAPPTFLSANQHVASSAQSFQAPFHFDHDYFINRYPVPVQPSPAHKETQPMHCKSDTTPNTLPKCQSRGRKRGRGEGQDRETSTLDDKNLGWTGEIQAGKRLRKLSLKAREVQEVAEVKAEAKKRKTSCKTRRTSQSKDEVVKQQETCPPGLHLQPCQPWRAPVPSSTPVNTLTCPLATPTLRFTSDSQKPLVLPVASDPKNIHYLNQPRALAVPPISTTHLLPQSYILRVPNPGFSCPSPPPSKLFLPYRGVVRVDPAEPPPLKREALQFDPSLMSLEPPEVVQDWLSGNRGVVVRGLGVALPYLPPFVSNLSTLTALLKAKKSLTESSSQLFSEPRYLQTKSRPENGTEKTPSQPPPVQPDSTSDPKPANDQPAPSLSSDHPQDEEEEEEQLVAAVRELVTERFSSNPAYQMLKARFLSCFTLPALLATIQPMTFPEEEEKEEEDVEEEMHQKQVKENQGRQRRAERSLLLCDGSGAPAAHFSGILNTNTATQDQTSPGH